MNQHGNGKENLWRCISYWTWGYSIAMLVYRRVQSLQQRPHVSGHTKNQGEGKQRRQKPLKFSKTVSCKKTITANHDIWPTSKTATVNSRISDLSGWSLPKQRDLLLTLHQPPVHPQSQLSMYHHHILVIWIRCATVVSTIKQVKNYDMIATYIQYLYNIFHLPPSPRLYIFHPKVPSCDNFSNSLWMALAL